MYKRSIAKWSKLPCYSSLLLSNRKWNVALCTKGSWFAKLRLQIDVIKIVDCNYNSKVSLYHFGVWPAMVPPQWCSVDHLSTELLLQEDSLFPRLALSFHNRPTKYVLQEFGTFLTVHHRIIKQKYYNLLGDLDHYESQSVGLYLFNLYLFHFSKHNSSKITFYRTSFLYIFMKLVDGVFESKNLDFFWLTDVLLIFNFAFMIWLKLFVKIWVKYSTIFLSNIYEK